MTTRKEYAENNFQTCDLCGGDSYHYQHKDCVKCGNWGGWVKDDNGQRIAPGPFIHGEGQFDN